MQASAPRSTIAMPGPGAAATTAPPTVLTDRPQLDTSLCKGPPSAGQDLTRQKRRALRRKALISTFGETASRGQRHNEDAAVGWFCVLRHLDMSVSASGNGGLLGGIDQGHTDALLARRHVELMRMGTARWEVAPTRRNPRCSPWRGAGANASSLSGSSVKRSLAFASTLPPEPRQSHQGPAEGGYRPGGE